ncbi:glycosyltransferase [Gymnodinialimonas sp.]
MTDAQINDAAATPAARSVHVLQPAIPTYRYDFFDRLAEAYAGRFFVHASQQDLGALTENGIERAWVRQLGPIGRLLPGVTWQAGAVGLPLKRHDVLILSGAPRTLSNIVLMLRARMMGVHVIWWGHYLSPGSPFWRRTLRIALMRLAHGALFYTDDEITAYRQSPAGRRDRRAIHALNNGLNTDPINAHRLAYGAADRPKDLLFIGRLTEKSGIKLAIEALANPSLSDVRLQVIGSGELEASAREQAESLGLGDRIIWNGALVDEAQIAAIANQCRAFVYPGAVGLSLIHAMAYGLPSILHGNTLGHMPEIAAFKDGVTGRAFDPGDPASLASVTGDLINDAAQLDLFATSALSIIERSHNSADMVARFKDAVSAFP